MSSMTKCGVDPKPVIPFSFVLKGPPVCGKKTLARRIGHLYYKMGLLATSEVVEASATDLIAGYIGQTALKTRKLMKSAIGKVLFIDEAYRLTGEHKYEGYAGEARNELVDAMRKPQFFGKIVIILAGYESNMNIMLDKDPGLRSRFRTHIRFSTLGTAGMALSSQNIIIELWILEHNDGSMHCLINIRKLHKVFYARG
jgi:AAA+ superfamily predicted ATPase